jgi:hypothetical protein
MLDPRLLGIARPVDIMGNIRQGIQDVQADQAFKLAQEQGALQNQILQQNVAAGDQAAIDAERERELQSVLAASNVIEPLLASGDPEKIHQVQNFLSVRSKQIADAGGNPEDTDQILGLINAGDTGTALNLVRNVQQLAPTTDKPSQFSASSLVKDEGGNVYSVTEKRNPNTGSVEQVYSAITPNAPETPQGAISIVSRSTGLTGAETVEQAAERTTKTEEAKQVAQRRQEAIRIGNVARSQVRSVRRMRTLLKDVETGGVEAIKKRVSDFFGFTPANAAELNNKFGQIILSDIKKLGANPTEGERAFLERISASFEQGNAANEAILSDMQTVLERQVERAQLLANNPDMTVQEAMIRQSEFTETVPQQFETQTINGVEIKRVK